MEEVSGAPTFAELERTSAQFMYELDACRDASDSIEVGERVIAIRGRLLDVMEDIFGSAPEVCGLRG